MTATTATAVRATVPPAAVLTRRFLRDTGFLTVWVWPAAYVIATVIVFTISRFTEITTGAWENAGQWPRWFLFSLGIAFTSLYLPVAVAHGITRRAVLRALATTIVVTSLAWAALMAVGHVAEAAIYAALDWPDTLTSPHLYTDGYDVVPMLAEYGLLFAAYMTAGVVVSGLYLRLGAWLGTACIPLALLPIAAVEALLSTGWVGGLLQEQTGEDRLAAPLAVAGSLVVIALTAAAAHALLRDVPLRSKTS
jgi:hypothetical protein